MIANPAKTSLISSAKFQLVQLLYDYDHDCDYDYADDHDHE